MKVNVLDTCYGKSVQVYSVAKFWFAEFRRNRTSADAVKVENIAKISEFYRVTDDLKVRYAR